LTRHAATPDGIAVPYSTEQVLLTLGKEMSALTFFF
jgi:hypothetical protein